MFSLLCAWLCPPAALALPNPDEARPEIVPVLTKYLNHLAAGEYDAAAEMTDVQGLTTHLMEQRIAVLKAQTPGMSPEEEAAARASLRENELHRDKIRQVLKSMMEEIDPKSITWQVTNIYSSQQLPNAFVVECSITRPSGKQAPLAVGLLKVGPQWFIAPQLLETARRPPAPAGPRKEIAPPEPIVVLGDMFWGHWKSGAMDEAYAMAGDALHQRMPLLKFLETTQALLAQIGPVESWKILSCAETAPGRVSALYEVRCTRQAVKGVLAFQKDGETWDIAAVVIPYLGP